MDSMEEYDPTLPLDLNGTSLNITRFDEGNKSFVSDPGMAQMTSANLLTNSDGRLSPGGNRKMKDFATQISELKKENFSLKLRIFYMEERMQGQFDGDHEEIYKTNIELKVECDSLRKELQDKHDLLVRASNAVACMEAGPEEVRKVQEQAQREMEQVKEAMNEKVHQADKELRAVRAEADSLAENVQKLQGYAKKLEEDNRLLKSNLDDVNNELDAVKELLPKEDDLVKDVVTSTNLEEINVLEQDIREKNKIIEQLRESLDLKQTMLEALTDEKKVEADSLQNCKETIKHLEEKNKALGDELQKTKQQDQRLRDEYTAYIELEHEYQEHIAEQQQRLDEFEIAARQMSDELDKREEEVRDLSDALKDAEQTGKELADKYERLKDEKDGTKTKDLVMRDKAIAGLTEVIRKKDEEISRLSDDAKHREFKLEQLTETVNILRSQESEFNDKLRKLNQLENELEELHNLKRDLEAINKKLASEVDESKDLIRSLDGKVREKDKELQDLLSKYKELLKHQQEEALAKDQAMRDSEDMARQFEREKREFAEIMENMKKQLRKSQLLANDEELSNKVMELQDKLQTVENLLRLKQNQLEETTSLYKRAESERSGALSELEAMAKRNEEELQREAESRNRLNAAKSAEINRLRDEIRVKDDRILNLEDDLLCADRTAHEASERSLIACREANRWKEDSKHKESVIQELMDNLKALGENAANSEREQVVKLTRENVELKQALKAKEAELAFLQSDEHSTNPYIDLLKKEIARKDKIIADERSKISEDTSTMNITLDSLRLEIENHERELANAKSTITALTAQLESTNNEIASLRKECQAKDRIIADMKLKRHYLALESEGGSSTATENIGRSSHRHHRQQRYTKKKSRHRRFDDDLSFCSTSTGSLNLDFDGSDVLSSGQQTPVHSDLNKELLNLQKEIADLKGAQRNEMDMQRLLAKLEKQKHRLRKLSKNLSAEQEIYRRHLDILNPSSNVTESALFGLDGDQSSSKIQLDVMLSEVEEVRNRLRELLLEVDETDNRRFDEERQLGQSISSTILPLNQTSYLQIPLHERSGVAQNSDQVVEDLRKQLKQLQAELDADRKKLLGWENKSYDWNKLKNHLEKENKDIKERLKEKMNEGELKDIEMSSLRIEVDKLRGLQLDVGRNSHSGHLTSGDESDGMSALSRKELHESIINLKKKLKNAEKLNELLGDQIESARQEKPDEPMAVTSSMTKKLSAEVDRLRNQLSDAQKRLNDARSPRSSSVPVRREGRTNRTNSKSRLPVPVEKKSENVGFSGKDASDPKKQAAHIAHLESKLAATEETVRQQTEKLKRAKAAMAAAGLKVPLSPVKPSQSHPNLFFSEPGASASRHTDGSSDNPDGRPHLSADDTGYASVTPRSEKKYNSLIQAQAKELSTLRRQLKRARETCKDLGTEYDIVLRYINSLLNSSEGQVDAMLASSVSNELERCKNLTRRLKEHLSEWTSDAAMSSDSDDGSASGRKLSLTKHQASQLLQKNQELESKNKKIQELEDQLLKLLNRNDESSFLKSKGRNQLPENFGYLTPTSSQHSILSNAEEELLSPVIRASFSRNTEYASLPEPRTPRPKSIANLLDDSFSHSPRTSRSLPMYQRTIAVTEYLPQNVENGSLKAPLQRRLPSTADAENCTASYGGSWGGNVTPRNSQDFNLSFNPEATVHSSPKRDSSELESLKKKFEDSKRLNESLKEELQLTTDALSRSTTSQVSSGRSPADILEEHLREIRILRQRLENSIETNDRLREQLERKLKQADRQSPSDHVSANIYLNADPREAAGNEIDSMKKKLARANDEITNLKNQLEAEICLKDNYAAASKELEQLRMRLVESSTQTKMLGSYIDDLNQSSADKDFEIQKLRERLEQLEDELKLANDRNEVNMLETNALRRNADMATLSADKMKADLNRLNEELDESRNLVHSLKSELALYEKFHKNKDGRSPAKSSNGQTPQNWNFDISEFLAEIKSLRVQLERSIEANTALRKQLKEQLRHSKDSSLINSPGRMTTINIHHLAPSQLDSSNGDDTSEGKLPDSGRGSTGARRKLKMPNGSYMIGRTKDYDDLKQVITDSRLLVRNMELKSSSGKYSTSTPSPSKSQRTNSKSAADKDKNLRLLQKMLEDSGRLLKHFWPASIPLPPELQDPPSARRAKSSPRPSDASSDVSKCTKDAGFASDTSINSEADGLRREVSKLHKRLSAQDKLLQSTVDRLQSANKLKEGIEHAILKQLTVTHDVLRKARGNLEAKAGDAKAKGKVTSAT